MLEQLLAMMGIDPAQFDDIKKQVGETAIKFNAMSDKIDLMAKQMDDMHRAFFQLVPRPAQQAEIVEGDFTEPTVSGEIITLNTPDTAFKMPN